MTMVIVGLSGGPPTWTVNFSPSGGSIDVVPGTGVSLSWTMASPTGPSIQAPVRSKIQNIQIGQATIPFPGGNPTDDGNGLWQTPDTGVPPATFGYNVTVSYAGQLWSSTDPEIVNSPPGSTNLR